jgi:hypothetical protein
MDRQVDTRRQPVGGLPLRARRVVVASVGVLALAAGVVTGLAPAASGAPSRPHPSDKLVLGTNVHIMPPKSKGKGQPTGGVIRPNGKASSSARVSLPSSSPSDSSGLDGSSSLSSVATQSSATAIAGPAGANLTYHGGKVISNIHSVPVIYGGGLYNPQVTAHLGTYPSMAGMLDAVSGAGSKYLAWLTQYDTATQSIGPGDAENPHVITPDPARDGPTITDAQIQTEIAAQIVAGTLPAPQLDASGNDNSVYTVFFPAGRVISTGFGSSLSSFCAYHGTIANVPGYGEVYYTVMPHFGPLFCNDGSVDPFRLETEVLGHEVLEAITDPEVGLANATADGTKIAWYDDFVNGEVADLCAWRGTLDTVGTDGHTYTPSTGWSNDVGACVVAPPVDGFSFSPPSSASLAKGSSTQVDVPTAVDFGSPGPITVTVTGIPSTMRSSTEVVNPGDTAHVIVRALPTATAQTYNLKVTATSFGTSRHASPLLPTTVGPLIDTSITSTNVTNFTEGTFGTFTIRTAAAGPVFPSITNVAARGPLPPGLSLTDNGDGTATVSGAPDAKTGKTWLVWFRSSNGVDPDSLQLLNVVISGPPYYAGPDSTTMTEGVYSQYTITTSGNPGSQFAFVDSPLPAGLSSTNLNIARGSALIYGTPAAGTAGDYPLTIGMWCCGFATAEITFTFTLHIAPGSGGVIPGDTSGPAVRFLSASPSVTNAGPLTVTATLDDSATGNNAVNVADMTIDNAPPAPGYGLTVLRAGGTSPTVPVSITLPPLALAGLADGPHTIRMQARDAAGNWSTTSTALFELDTTGPVAAPTASPAPNGAAWNTEDVDVTWHWSDGSGVGVDPANCTTSTTSTGQGSGISVSATCSDALGNLGTASYSVNVDKTGPDAAPSKSPAATSYGWNNTDVTVTWNWADPGGSGIDPAHCDTSTASTGEGAVVPVTGSCSDVAGNTGSGSTTVKVDKARPVTTVTGVTAGATYLLGAPAPWCSSTDDRSGVALEATPALSGGTSGVGTITATCSGATDKAGNTAEPASVTILVGVAFGKFNSPLPKTTVSKAGANIPVKFGLVDSKGKALTPVTAAALGAAGLLSVTLSGPKITTPTPVTAVWDPVNLQFQANIKTPTTVATGTSNPYTITVKERIGTSLLTVPSLGPTLNPETIYLK